MPSALLQQEIEVDIQHPTLENTSQIAVTNAPTHPQVLTRQEQIEEAHQRAREWAAEQYPSQS